MSNVSVALATYNGEAHLPAQLESLANQTAPPSELVVADDGSSDATLDIIAAFAEKSPFEVRIIQNEHRLGYRRNFMQASVACHYDLIAFCDQDDIWQPEKLATMRGLFDDTTVLLAYHNAALIDEAGKSLGTLFGRGRAAKAFAPLTIHPWIPIPGHTQIVRRSLVRFSSLHGDSVDPYCLGEPMPHDYWYPFWASVLGKVVYIPKCLTQYRQHEGNVSGWPHIGWLNYATDHVSNAAHYVAAEYIGADNRRELLRRSRDLMRANEIPRVDAALAYYEILRDRSKMRRAVYEEETFSERARALLKLVRCGGYFGTRSETFGLPALLLDAAVGVPTRRIGR
jgi:glycosyltransferase involved in cell wall biosynthesis